MMEKGCQYVKKLEMDIMELRGKLKDDKKGEGNEREREGEGGKGAEGVDKREMKAPEKKEDESTEQEKDGVEGEDGKEVKNEGEGKGEDKYSNYMKINGSIAADRGRGDKGGEGQGQEGEGTQIGETSKGKETWKTRIKK